MDSPRSKKPKVEKTLKEPEPSMDAKLEDASVVKDGVDSSSSMDKSKEIILEKSTEDGDGDDSSAKNDDEEMKLLKIIQEYKIWTMRDPVHGQMCMSHFYDKWLKKYRYPQANSSMFDLSVQIAKIYKRYQDQLQEFPHGEVGPFEDEYDPIYLSKFRLSHEIWKDIVYVSTTCESFCEQDYSVSDDEDGEDEDGNGASGDDEEKDGDEDGNGAGGDEEEDVDGARGDDEEKDGDEDDI